MAERSRIATYFAPLAAHESGAFGLTDDAAVLNPPAGKSVVVTTDSVIQGIHLLPDATASQFSQKLLRRNLSDLAAMGATPWRYFLNMHTPAHIPEKWFREFCATLAQEQQQFGLTLAGGDSTSGGETIHLTMTCLGLIAGSPLRRNAAQINDDVYVSGTIGDAALGLDLLRNMPAAISEKDRQDLIGRYYRPQPRLALGKALRQVAHACIDISDGLLADAQQIASASGVKLQLQQETIPLSVAAQSLQQNHPHFWERILNGGDDYELLFTAPVSARTTLQNIATQLAIPLTCIGHVGAGTGVSLIDGLRNEIAIPTLGYEHR